METTKTTLPFVKVTMLALAVVALSACGFELRGTGKLPDSVQTVYVDSSRDLRKAIVSQVERDGTRVVADKANADLSILVQQEGYERRVLSVDGRTGKAREYELLYRMTLSAHRTAGNTLIIGQPITLSRDYLFDADAVIGKTEEEDVIRQEMRRDAAEQIVRRVNAVL